MVFSHLAPFFSFSDDFFNKNGVYQLCFRQSKLNDCTIWYHSNGAVVWCSRLKSQNGAVVDGTIVVFYGTSDRLGDDRVELGHRGGIHRVVAPSTSEIVIFTPNTGAKRCIRPPLY